MTDRLTKAIVDLRNQGQPIVPAKALTFGNPGDSITVQLPGSTSTKTVLAGSPINSSNVVVAGGYAFCESAPRVVGTETKRFLHKKPEKLIVSPSANIKYLFSQNTGTEIIFWIGGWKKDSIEALRIPSQTIRSASIDNLGGDDWFIQVYGFSRTWTKGSNGQTTTFDVTTVPNGVSLGGLAWGGLTQPRCIGYGFFLLGQTLKTGEIVEQDGEGIITRITSLGETLAYLESNTTLVTLPYISSVDAQLVGYNDETIWDYRRLPGKTQRNTLIADAGAITYYTRDVYSTLRINKTKNLGIGEHVNLAGDIQPAYYQGDAEPQIVPVNSSLNSYYLDVQSSGFTGLTRSDFTISGLAQDKNVDVKYFNLGFTQTKTEKIGIYKLDKSGVIMRSASFYSSKNK